MRLCIGKSYIWFGRNIDVAKVIKMRNNADKNEQRDE